MFQRHGIEISRKTMRGWMAQCAGPLDPLYRLMKNELSIYQAQLGSRRCYSLLAG